MKYVTHLERYVQARNNPATIRVAQSGNGPGMVVIETKGVDDAKQFGYFSLDLDAELVLVLAEAMVLAAKEALELAKKAGQS